MMPLIIDGIVSQQKCRSNSSNVGTRLQQECQQDDRLPRYKETFLKGSFVSGFGIRHSQSQPRKTQSFCQDGLGSNCGGVWFVERETTFSQMEWHHRDQTQAPQRFFPTTL